MKLLAIAVLGILGFSVRDDDTNRVPMLVLKGTNAAPPGASATNLAAGTYKSSPFSCIVVVPQEHLDQAMVVKPAANPGLKTPVIRPDLRLTPLQITPKAGRKP